MDVASRPSIKKGGSVWDNRMKSKSDHLRGGVKGKLCNAINDDLHLQHSPISPTPTRKAPIPMRGARRKSWNQPANDNANSPSDQIAKSTSSPSWKTRSDVVGDANRSPKFLRKVKSTADGLASANPASLAVIEDSECGRRLEVDKMIDESGIGSHTIKLGNSGKEVSDESLDPSFDEITIPIEKDICSSLEPQEKLLACSSGSVNGNVNECNGTDFNADEEADEADEKSVEEENDIGTKAMSYDVKEVHIADNKIMADRNNDALDMVSQTSDKKAAIPAVKWPPRNAYVKRSAFYLDFNKSSQSLTKATANFSKPSPKYSKPGSRFTIPSPNITSYAASTPQPCEFQRHPDTRDRLQSLVDIVMWRDVSRSAFVFGTGTLMIMSSSYTQDLNISFISVTSYLGLAYLALIFLFRSILHRENTHEEDESIIREAKAIWIVKLVLPYVNEFFISLRALFSGDPATTMKLAVVLFFLARCGGSITICKMAKIGFIGVFIVPKVVSLYSVQLKTQCKFWTARLRDAWDSCTQKKIIAGIIFSLIWNLCSVVASIWALFMVVVAFRYYQQLMAVDEEWEVEDAAADDETKEKQPLKSRIEQSRPCP